eukprot:352942-Chlamydomonas_euryale.AAC.2
MGKPASRHAGVNSAAGHGGRHVGGRRGSNAEGWHKHMCSTAGQATLACMAALQAHAVQQFVWWRVTCSCGASSHTAWP